MPPFNVRAPVTASVDSTQWPSDPTAELDFEEFLGLREAPNRPPVARARMTLFKSPERTVAIIEGWKSYPPIVDILPGASAPVRSKKQRKAKDETALRLREITRVTTFTRVGSAEDEELLTTHAAALYCGYLSEVGIRKAKHDGLLASVGVGRNRSLLWRRSDLDAHNLRRGYVPSDAQGLSGRVVNDERTSDREAAEATETLAAGDTPPVPVDAPPEVTEPGVEPIVVAASASSAPTNVSDEVPTSVEEHPPPMTVSDSIEILPAALVPLAEWSEPPGPTPASAPATDDGQEHTATGGLDAVTTPSWRRRPLAAVLQVVLWWEVFAGASEPVVPAASPEVPPTPVIPSPRCKTGVPYRGALLARQRHRASG